MRRGALVVFAKAPEPGRVKTRMCPPLTPDQAAALYGCMLDDVLEASARFCAEAGVALVVAVDPPGACASLAERLDASRRGAARDAAFVAQRGRDLGARMQTAIAEAAAAGCERVVLRGSDSPALPAARLAEAFAALERADVVLAPDRDGGYAAIGVRRPHAGLLDHAMSTPRVAQDTLARAGALGLRARLLAPGFDLDDAADLAHLARERASLDARACRRTLRKLDDEGWWPAPA
ncbi:MAG: TIGR04282 family arsenosugar biosynthesis glycosyltransferase [Myxococcota bacterium]